MLEKIKTHREFFLFVSILTIFRMVYITLIPILPQEAYYWYYSLNPDFSYFDHPPMTAYSIGLGTWLFGKSIFGVKFMGVIWSAVTNILIYMTTFELLDGIPADRRRYWSVMSVFLYNCTLFAHIYAVILVPDTPLLCFWILTILMIVKFHRSLKPKYLYFTGISLGLGMLSKYPAIAILPSIFIILMIDRRTRKVFFSPHPYLALLLAALIFMPVVFWNIEHSWASFSFQFSERADELKTIQTKYILQLLASQLFILTPLPLALFGMETGRVLKNWRTGSDVRNLFITGVFIIGGFTITSLRSLVKMNWLMPGYLGMIPGVTLLYREKKFIRSFWIKAGAVFSLVLILSAHLILLIPNIPLGEANTWSGWENAAGRIAGIQDSLGGEKSVFIFANSYKAASLVKFYMKHDQEVYAQNIYGQPALQFDIWGIPDSLHGKDALYIFSDRYEYKSDLHLVEQYFDEVTPLRLFLYYFDDRKTRVISCYYARNYAGVSIKKTESKPPENFRSAGFMVSSLYNGGE